MTLTPATPALVHEAFESLRRRCRGQRAFTNYFQQPLDRVPNLRMTTSVKTVCLVHDEWDFGRLYFTTYDIDDLQQLLESMNWPPIVITDWIAREPSPTIGPTMVAAGFHLHTVYERIVCSNFRRARTDGRVVFAQASERDAIHALLFQVFDKYADHIMSADALQDLIAQQRVLTTHDEDGINGFVIFPVNGSTCNFNFLYNRGGTKNLATLLGNFYGILSTANMQSGISWVRRTRSAVLGLHQSFGWKRDGLVDYIFAR